MDSLAGCVYCLNGITLPADVIRKVLYMGYRKNIRLYTFINTYEKNMGIVTKCEFYSSYVGYLLSGGLLDFLIFHICIMQLCPQLINCKFVLYFILKFYKTKCHQNEGGQGAMILWQTWDRPDLAALLAILNLQAQQTTLLYCHSRSPCWYLSW